MSGNGRTTARSHLPLGDGIDQGGDDDAEGEHGCDETTGTETATIARELVSLCQAGRNMEAIEKFYSPNIVSVESVGNE